MRLRNFYNQSKATLRQWVSFLGLTRAEAAFIFFLSLAALIGAILSSLHSPSARPLTDKHLLDIAADQLFRALSHSDSTDPALADSLYRYFYSTTDPTILWAKRADSLRHLLENKAPLSSVDSFIASSGDEPVRKININTANLHTLTLLPGVGPKMAERIIAYREENGPFRRPEDLMRIRGIGKKTFAKLKPYIDI